jgi:predicted phage gp36 major capsid-like protein
MKPIILSFVNLSRQDAFLSVADGSGDLVFVARLAPGQAARQVSASGQEWNVVASDSYQITAGDSNRAYLISATGVHEVSSTRAIASESGVAIDDDDFQGYGGGMAPST